MEEIKIFIFLLPLPQISLHLDLEKCLCLYIAFYSEEDNVHIFIIALIIPDQPTGQSYARYDQRGQPSSN